MLIWLPSGRVLELFNRNFFDRSSELIVFPQSKISTCDLIDSVCGRRFNRFRDEIFTNYSLDIIDVNFQSRKVISGKAWKNCPLPFRKTTHFRSHSVVEALPSVLLLLLPVQLTVVLLLVTVHPTNFPPLFAHENICGGGRIFAFQDVRCDGSTHDFSG